MSSLSEIEKRYFEELFGMRSGYVLDFSDFTFAEFFRNTVRVDIDDPKYGRMSKGKRLRSFWEQETDALVGKVLGELLKLWVYNQPDRAAALKDYSYLEGRRTVARLTGQSSGNEVSSEDDFLGKDFGSIDLKALNLEAGLLPILESRLKEIRVCLDRVRRSRLLFSPEVCWKASCSMQRYNFLKSSISRSAALEISRELFCIFRTGR